MPLHRRRVIFALALVLASAGLSSAACTAIVGVEDVHLADTRETGPDGPDDLDAPDDQVIADGGFVLAEASVQVTAGFLHTCAREMGHIKCWGGNDEYMLGGGEAGANLTESKVPLAVVGITDAIAVSAGNSHSCVVRSSGTVSCWGQGIFGQLGNAATDDQEAPVDAIGITNAVSVSCGSTFTCAVLATGEVSCWGDNSYGQLGDGTTIDRTTPAVVSQLAGATQVTAAMEHACAVTGGSVKCWGTNDVGQLGNGTTTKSYVPTLAAATNAVEVVAASSFTCARDVTGQVTCWGSNQSGELGTGSANPAPNPSPAITSVHDAVGLAAGYEHACALRRTGQVMCWGAAGDGQIGTGSMLNDDAGIPRPTLVVGVTNALEISAGGDHSCAVTSAGGVECWGDNSFGQIGNGTENNAYAAVPVTGYP